MRDRKAAKELLHIEGWLDRSVEIVARGKDACLADDLLQEAGDSLMMNLGEAANRLSQLDYQDRRLQGAHTSRAIRSSGSNLTSRKPRPDPATARSADLHLMPFLLVQARPHTRVVQHERGRA